MLKAVVSFYRIDSETAFECHRSRIPINNVNTVLALKKHLISFLGLKELSSKYGLGDFDVKQFYLNFGRAMESGASDHTSWNRKRIKQYVLEWFGIWY